MIWQDVRYGARVFTKNPGFTIVAVVTLALSIGANALIFTLLDTIYRRPLPVERADRVVHVVRARANSSNPNFTFSDYLYLRDHNDSFSALAAHYSRSPMNVVVDSGSREINGAVVTANYFDVLKLRAAAGRFFTSEEDRVLERSPVAVISHDLWRGQFHADSQIIGKGIKLNGADFTVIGVAPATFHGVNYGGLNVDVWIASAMFRVGYRYCDVLTDRTCDIVVAIGRLKDGRTIADGQADLDVLTRQLATAFPKEDAGLSMLVEPARGAMTREMTGLETRMPILLAAAVALVLSIACANIAGLLLARSLNRQREIAVRLAIGAGRARLVRQLVVESLMLSTLGGIASLLVTFWAKDGLLTFYAANSEGQRAYFTLDLDPLVIAATAGVTVLAGLAFGLVPALQATRPSLLPALKDVGLSGTPRSRTRDVLVASQVAISIVLLVGAGLLVRSLSTVYSGQGFDPRPVVLLRLRPSLLAQTAARAKVFQQDVIRRVEALPGVLSASPAAYPPLPGWDDDRVHVWLPAQPAPLRKGEGYGSAVNIVGPRYFQTLGVPIVSGRDFDDRDRRDTLKVAIINDTLARHFWPGRDAVGETVVVDGDRYQVAGVSRLAQYRSAGEAPRPMVYLNYWQVDSIDIRPVDSRTHVRVSGDVRTMLQRIRREIAAIDPAVPISEDRPLTEWLDYGFGPVRAARTMLVSFSMLAMFLSAIGLYGVMASAVSHRRREIAIRMALGATQIEIARMVLGQSAALVGAGIGVGLIVALTLARVLTSFLYGVGTYDLLTIGATCAILAAVGLIASYVPVKRATRTDPIAALRWE